ncbi:MAG TPA: MarR family transcriptional regulator [Gemmatimonadaceae bacterium]|jgi:MarR family 2-MHQ and catechol resistance regulon transcriptional repressor
MTARPDGAHTFLVLSRATRAVEARALASIEDAGLCASDFGVLEALLHKGALPVNTLGKTVLLTSGSITTSVDRLADRGLVARQNDPTDRRVRIVSLTADGRRLIKSAFARHAADLDEIMSALTANERSTLVSLLRKLGRNADGTIDGLEEAS